MGFYSTLTKREEGKEDFRFQNLMGTGYGIQKHISTMIIVSFQDNLFVEFQRISWGLYRDLLFID